jgi:hypothetical protein
LAVVIMIQVDLVAGHQRVQAPGTQGDPPLDQRQQRRPGAFMAWPVPVTLGHVLFAIIV